MELIDICPLETWATLENEIYEKSGLNPAVYDTEGVRINANPRWPNRLCPQIKASSKGQSFICATAHMNLANQARQERQPVIEECDAGMIKLVVPIFVGDNFLGTVGGCGQLLDDGEVDTFLVNKTTGLDEQQVALLAEGTSAITTAQAESLAHFIAERVASLVSNCRCQQ